MFIVIAMAGKSERFIKAGFGPKYALPLGDSTLFDWVVSGFRNYRDSRFIFVTADEASDRFVDSHTKQLGLQNYCKVRDKDQKGYGPAVLTGLRVSQCDLQQPVIISPIDTYRPDFKLPGELGNRSFAELCIVGKNNEQRLNGWAKPRSLEEPAQGAAFMIAKHRYTFIPWRRSTGVFYFQSAASFVSHFNRKIGPFSMPSFLADTKVGEWVEWLGALRGVEKCGSPVSVRLINRADVVFAGRPDEYKIVRDHWPKRFGRVARL